MPLHYIYITLNLQSRERGITIQSHFIQFSFIQFISQPQENVREVCKVCMYVSDGLDIYIYTYTLPYIRKRW